MIPAWTNPALCEGSLAGCVGFKLHGTLQALTDASDSITNPSDLSLNTASVLICFCTADSSRRFVALSENACCEQLEHVMSPVLLNMPLENLKSLSPAGRNAAVAHVEQDGDIACSSELQHASSARIHPVQVHVCRTMCNELSLPLPDRAAYTAHAGRSCNGSTTCAIAVSHLHSLPAFG